MELFPFKAVKWLESVSEVPEAIKFKKKYLYEHKTHFQVHISPFFLNTESGLSYTYNVKL